MALTPRQLALYQHQVDVWRPNLDPAANAVLVASAVPCLFTPIAGNDRMGKGGRQDREREARVDSFSLPAGQDIRTGDHLHIVAAPAGSADEGRWFSVLGEPQRNAIFANRQKVFVTASMPPPGV